MKQLLNAAMTLALLGGMVDVSAAENDAPLQIGATGAPPRVVLLEYDAVTSGAAERLAMYMGDLTGTSPQLTYRIPVAGSAIVLGGPAIAKEYGITGPDSGSSESFSIAPISRNGRTLLVVSGQSGVGVKQGVYHVLRNMHTHNGNLLLDNATTQITPFLKVRASHLGGYTVQHLNTATGGRLTKGARATPDQEQWNLIQHWEPQRLGAYVDMLDFFGYNNIECPPGFYSPKDRQSSTTERRKTLRGHALRNGMTTTLKIDGTMAGSGDGAVPYGDDTSTSYASYYRGFAETAARDSDYVLTHWVDAGGWKSTPEHPCTIELLQDLHMKIYREFQHVNPAIQSYLSLWNLDNPAYQRWLGYRGVDTILNSGKIPPEVGIAMHKGYRPIEAARITGTSHPAGVWSWYVADNELLYTMHVHTHIMQKYFASLPREAASQIAFHELDNCQRETNIYSIYVGARLMWDPYQDSDIPLREIARLVYGPKLEQPVFDALKAIADVRCGGGPCRGMWNPGATSATRTLDTTDGITSNGVVTFADGYFQANAAWKALQNVQIDSSYVTPVRFHRDSGVLLAELKGHTKAVAMYMQYLKDRLDHKPVLTEVPRAPGAFEYYERMRWVDDQLTSMGAAAYVQK
jgi:hypothetical protein